MKLSLLKEKLLKALSTVLRIVSNQVTLPILSNVLISSDNGRLKIAATDLELGIETWIGAKIIKDGSITIPAKLLYELINSISDEKIELEVADNKITIIGKKSHSTIKGMAANDFPLIPRIKNPLISIKIKASVLKNAIAKNSFASATDETRPVLTGILLKITKENYILASTDSYRLCEFKIPHKQKITNATEVIIPRRTMLELARIATNDEDEIKIDIGENQIVFSFGNIYFISRIIEGSFPEYEQIIPKKFDTIINIEKSLLMQSLKGAVLFSRDSANNIKVSCDKDKNSMLIKAYSQQVGENQSEIAISKFTGNNIKFAINASFLGEAISSISQNILELKLINAQSPILIKALKDPDYFCIIMPLRQEE